RATRRGRDAAALQLRRLQRRDDAGGPGLADERLDAALAVKTQSIANRSLRSSFVSVLAPPASSLSTDATRSFFFALSCRIFSSMVPAATRRYTVTTFFWPIRCARSEA